MEHIAYDTTISESYFSRDALSVGLSHHEENHLMQQLMASIDLHTLASTYFQQLETKLQARSVKITFASGSLTLGDADKSCNIKTLDFEDSQHNRVTVSYALGDVLSIREQATLHAMHHLFAMPMRHALDFYHMKQVAMKDHLTSLGNRANYQESLQRLISQAKRHSGSFGLLVIDLDKFKRLNDTFGHQEGDKVLMSVADVLQHCIRDTDYAFRFGGDEFCCLIANAEDTLNASIARRIQSAMRGNTLLARHGVTCSIGSATFADGDDEQSLFRRADRALYAAKHAGRSCIEAA